MASRVALAQINPNEATGRASLAPGRLAATKARPSMAPSSFDQRKSLAPTRPSLGGTVALSRRSSVFGGVGAGGPPQRQLSENIDILARFLAERSFAMFANVPAVLRQPNNKDFYTIFAFLFRRIDPGFSLSQQKPEEDVINAFRLLKYPYMMNKSNLKSVGSPHSWPNILAALVWLAQGLSYLESQDNANVIATISDERLFFRFLHRAYDEYLDGKDDFSDLEDELAQLYCDRNQPVLEELEFFQQQNALMREEIEALQAQEREKAEFEKRKADMCSDLEKFRSHIANLERHKQDITARLEERKSELRTLENQKLQLEQEKLELSQQIDQQQQNEIDGDKLNGDRSLLEQSLSQVSQRKEAMLQQRRKVETDLTRQLEQLEEQIDEYRSCATQFKLIPITNKNADGVAFDIEFNVHALQESNNEAQQISTHIKDIIKPGLVQLRDKFTRQFGEWQERRLSLQIELDRVEETMQERQFECEHLSAMLNKTDQATTAEKKRLQEHLQRLQSEMDKMQRDLLLRQQATQEGLDHSFQVLGHAQALLEQQRDTLAEERAIANNQLIVVLGQLMDHKGHIEERLKVLQAQMQQAINTL